MNSGSITSTFPQKATTGRAKKTRPDWDFHLTLASGHELVFSSDSKGDLGGICVYEHATETYTHGFPVQQDEYKNHLEKYKSIVCLGKYFLPEGPILSSLNDKTHLSESILFLYRATQLVENFYDDYMSNFVCSTQGRSHFNFMSVKSIFKEYCFYLGDGKFGVLKPNGTTKDDTTTIEIHIFEQAQGEDSSYTIKFLSKTTFSENPDVINTFFAAVDSSDIDFKCFSLHANTIAISLYDNSKYNNPSPLQLYTYHYSWANNPLKIVESAFKLAPSTSALIPLINNEFIFTSGKFAQNYGNSNHYYFTHLDICKLDLQNNQLTTTRIKNVDDTYYPRKLISPYLCLLGQYKPLNSNQNLTAYYDASNDQVIFKTKTLEEADELSVLTECKNDIDNAITKEIEDHISVTVLSQIIKSYLNNDIKPGKFYGKFFQDTAYVDSVTIKAPFKSYQEPSLLSKTTEFCKSVWNYSRGR